MLRLDPRVITLWRLQGGIRLLTFWLPVSFGLAFPAGLQFGYGAGAAVVGLVFGFGLVMAVLWPSVRWRSFGYEVREHDLLVSQGVLFRHTVSVPLSRIQHVDTRQGPLERSWGLASVVVYTAAGMSADGSIPGLDEAAAADLRDTLARRGGDDGV